MFNNKNILITGGTGSFGKKFIKVLLKKYKPKRLVIFSRDELKQYELRKKLEPKHKCLRFFLGDVRDVDRLDLALNGIDFLVHAAALKQVPAAEYNPTEFIKTNILGAQNIVSASIKNNVKKVIALSTDKASNPINLYGATKLVSDKLFISANNYVGKKNVSFSVVRYGNVINSRGSVIPFFLDLNKEKSKYFPITDKDMTRFLISLEGGVDFVLNSFKRMRGGEVFIPKIPSAKIADIALAINPKLKQKIIGIRPGEKIHEVLFSSDEAHQVIEFKNYYTLTPTIESFGEKFINYRKDISGEKGKFIKKGFEYSSKTASLLSINDLKKMIDAIN